MYESCWTIMVYNVYNVWWSLSLQYFTQNIFSVLTEGEWRRTGITNPLCVHFIYFLRRMHKTSEQTKCCKVGGGVPFTVASIRVERLYKGVACSTPFNFTLTRITLNQLSFSWNWIEPKLYPHSSLHLSYRIHLIRHV